MEVYEVNTIRETIKRLRHDGLRVPENALRQWVRDGSIRANFSGSRAYLYYPEVVEAIKNGISKH